MPASCSAPPARGPQHRPLRNRGNRGRVARSQVRPRCSQRINSQLVRLDRVHLPTVETQLARGQIEVPHCQPGHFLYHEVGRGVLAGRAVQPAVDRRSVRAA